MKSLLLTGSGGFVGGNLKKIFNEYKIFSPRSFELDFTNENLVASFFNEHDADLIIHCGSIGSARGLQDKDTTVEDNIKMVDNILKYKNKDTYTVLFGSGAMYGKQRPLKKVSEDEIGKVVPYDLYGKSKVLISEMVDKRADVLCLNIFGCYGYDEKETRFPTYAIKRKLENKPIEINQNVVFDYLFIEDLAEIIKQLIKIKPEKNIINVTPTESISLLEISNIVNSFSDNKVEVVIKNLELNNEYTGSNSRLLHYLPDFKFTPYKEGLFKLYEYIKAN